LPRRRKSVAKITELAKIAKGSVSVLHLPLDERDEGQIDVVD
jgi:hypothetical protein